MRERGEEVEGGRADGCGREVSWKLGLREENRLVLLGWSPNSLQNKLDTKQDCLQVLSSDATV